MSTFWGLRFKVRVVELVKMCLLLVSCFRFDADGWDFVVICRENL